MKSTDKLLVLDFDLYKHVTLDQSQKFIKQLTSFAKKLDMDLIKSPSGGVHIYVLQGQDKITRLMDWTCKFGFPHIDYLGTASGVIGPDYEREILCSRASDFASLPQGLEPAFSAMKKVQLRRLLEKNLPDSFPHSYKKGCRRRMGLALIRMFQMQDSSLVQLNENFMTPSKTSDEFKREVLNQRANLEPARPDSTRETVE